MNPTHEAIALPPAVTTAPAGQHARAILLILAVISVLGYFDLGRSDVTNSLEVSYALTAQEMVRGDDWLVPRLNERPRFVKPPLPFWLGAGVCELVHGDAAPMPTLRLVALAAGALAALCVYGLGVSMFDRRAGLLAALAWVTMFLCFLEYRYARHDIFLTAAVALSMLGIWRAWARQRGGWLLTAIGLIFAFQCKGPVSWPLTVLPAAVFAVCHRPVRWRFIGGVLAWALVGGLSLLPWVVAVQHATDVDFWDEYRWEAIGRFTSESAPYQPPWFYLQYLGFVLPWVAYLIAGLVVPFERKYAARGRALRFAWMWMVVGLAFMTLPREKNSRYVVPLLAPAALLTGQVLAFHWGLWRRRQRDPAAPPLWIGHTIVLGVTAAVMIVGSYRAGYDVALGAGVVNLLLAGAVGWCFRVNRLPGAVALSVAFAVLGLLSFGISQHVSPRHAEPNRQLAAEVLARVGDAPLVAWPNTPPHALAYYANRTMPAVANPYLMHRYVPEVDRQTLAERWGRLDARRADQARALERWLQQQDAAEAYVVSDLQGVPRLRAFADERGLDASVVLDLTTIRPHTGKPGDAYRLVRLARRGDAPAGE